MKKLGVLEKMNRSTGYLIVFLSALCCLLSIGVSSLAASGPIDLKANLVLSDTRFIMYETAEKGLTPFGEYDVFLREKKLFTVRLVEVGPNYALAEILPPAGYANIEGQNIQLLEKLTKESYSGYPYLDSKKKKKNDGKPPIKKSEKPEKPAEPEKPKITREVINPDDFVVEEAVPEKPKKKQDDSKVPPPVVSSVLRFNSVTGDSSGRSDTYTGILSITSQRKDNIRSGYLLFIGNYQDTGRNNDTVGVGVSITHNFSKKSYAMGSYTFLVNRNDSASVVDQEMDSVFLGLGNIIGYHDKGRGVFKTLIGYSSDSSLTDNNFLAGTLTYTRELRDKSSFALSYKYNYSYDYNNHIFDTYGADLTFPFRKKHKVTFGYRYNDRDTDVYGPNADNTEDLRVTLFTTH